MLLVPRPSLNAARAFVLLGLAVTACGTPVTLTLASPAPEPPISGNYTLVVTASATCAALSVTRMQWPVVAQYATNPLGYPTVTALLPAPAPTLELDFTYASDVAVPTRAVGSLGTPIGHLANGVGVPIPGTSLKLDTTASVVGSVAPSPDGRGQINEGSLTGDIQILSAGNAVLGSCTANDHLWSLVPR